MKIKTFITLLILSLFLSGNVFAGEIGQNYPQPYYPGGTSTTDDFGSEEGAIEDAYNDLLYYADYYAPILKNGIYEGTYTGSYQGYNVTHFWRVRFYNSNVYDFYTQLIEVKE